MRRWLAVTCDRRVVNAPARGYPGKESSVATQTDLELEISSLALVDTHEHLLPEDQWAGDNAKLIEGMREADERGWGDASPDILQDLFMNYVPSDLEVAGATKEALRRLFDPAAGDIESRFAGIREHGRQHSSRATVRRFG